MANTELPKPGLGTDKLRLSQPSLTFVHVVLFKNRSQRAM